MKILSTSDHHPGRFGLGERGNVDALAAASRLGLRQNVDMFIANGDVLEEFLVQNKPGAIRPEVYDRQCRIIGDAFRLFCRESKKPVTVVRGNHDLDLTEAFLHSRLNPHGHADLLFDVRDDLILRPHPDVVITHGHILHGTRRARNAVDALLKSDAMPEDILSLLNGDASLESAARADADDFDRKIIHRVAMATLHLGILPVLEGWVAPRLLGFAKSAEQSLHEEVPNSRIMKSVSKRVSGMTDGMAHLVRLLKAKVGIVGHDHQHALVTRNVRDPRSGTLEKVIVANSGDWIGHMRPKAAILVDTDERTVAVKRLDRGDAFTDLFPVKRYER